MKKYVNGEFVDLTPEEVKQIQDLENFSGGEVEETNQGELELIADVTIEEEVANVSISVDKNGKPFKLKKALLFWFFPKYEGDSEIPTTYYEQINDLTSQVGCSLLNNGNAMTNANKQFKKCGFWEIELKEHKVRHERAVRGVTYKDDTVFGLNAISAKESGEAYKVGDTIESIESIGFKHGLAFAGCKFILYGVRI